MSGQVREQSANGRIAAHGKNEKTRKISSRSKGKRDMPEVTKRHNSMFPIGIQCDGRNELYTLKGAKQLRIKLNNAIEWAVNEEQKMTKLKKSVTEAMDMLRNMSMGAIGKNGPTIAELNAFVEEDGGPWGDNSDYHTVQWAWRKLEEGMAK